MPLKGKTWAAKGTKQVEITALDDKRQFTAFPVINAAGEVCAHVQLTWQGLSNRSCPNMCCQAKYAEHLTHVATPSHWSTPCTVEAAVDDIYLSYVVPKCLALGIIPSETYWLIEWDVYSSHRGEEILARLKAKYPRLIIIFIPASCTGELQPLDVGFNGPWKCLITKFAAQWLSMNIREQLVSNPDPTKVSLGLKKSDLVEPFCGWITAATVEMKNKPGLIRRCWEKTGVMVAWSFGSPERDLLLQEANKLQAAGKLWQPIVNKTFQDGTVPRTRLVCHGALQDVGFEAARSVGGFGDLECAEDECITAPADFDVMGEPAEGVAEEFQQEKKGKKGVGRRAEKKEEIEESEDKREDESEDESEDDESEHLPRELCEQFEAKVTRSGRFSVLPQKFRNE